MQVEDAFLEGAHNLLALRRLQDLSLQLGGQAAVVFSRHASDQIQLPLQPRNVRRVRLDMHSVFDCTDCLEGLQLTAEVEQLTVTLTSDTSRTPHEVHWAIKPDSLLARASALSELNLTCTTMLIRTLPPVLTRLWVKAKAISISSYLKGPLKQLNTCELIGKVYWINP